MKRRYPAKRQSHGGSKTPEYSCWTSMIRRCSVEEDLRYKDYGARGISVCERWRDSFPAFLEDMGPRPSPKHSLDRIDNDGNYEPGNCRWALWHEQMANRRARRNPDPETCNYKRKIDRQEAEAMFRQGKTGAEIAKHFGVSQQAVSQKFPRDVVAKLRARPEICPHCGKPL